jgi:ABC-2 type transport system ATP-binding protein
MPNTVIEVQNLVVEYGKGRRAVRAVDGLSFRVEEGECVGFIGANGAGKSTTMKAIMGFLFPKSGAVRVFGEPAGTARSRQRIGYLPEVALYYPFMKARELLELYGGLSGLRGAGLKRRISEILERVGLGGRGEALLRNFSKGMQQRLGIAQSLIADPEALIFDELSSGLDPLGRHDLREVLLDLRRRGRTIFFSSHELSEVESLCDRVVIIHQGRVVTQATVAELMRPLNEFEIDFAARDGAELPESVARFRPSFANGRGRVSLQSAAQCAEALAGLAAAGFEIQRTASRVRSLEEHFIEIVGAARKKP